MKIYPVTTVKPAFQGQKQIINKTIASKTAVQENIVKPSFFNKFFSKFFKK